jgi:serine/threonine protein kinase/tetratricopeptide (TPR) repeat protein
MDERSIFMAALAQESPPERSAFLDEACGGDQALRQRVEALLASHEQAGSFLGKPVPERLAEKLATPQRLEETGAEAPATEHIPRPIVEGQGSHIGPYKLLQEIGEGGMGTVWLAEQSQPVRRMVALKIIKPGMDSQQVIARFEAERQALALMDHPNIARVFDAGTVAGRQSAVSSQEECLSSLPSATCPPPSGEGRPYFVMELVKGVPITKYCDEHRLTPKQRLELFLPVCQAIQHAHQKGIIHRDIKPSNVLVASYDDRPMPKVIDFGIAKAAGQPLTEKTLVTGFGMIVGTLEYMSPEQAMLNALDIDTRSDVYSLGVLLYELLTGTTPFETKRLKKAAFDEILRIIRMEEPPPPSTRLSTTDEAPSVAANRGMEPKKLSALVKGELDWIVMKALEKDRNRRYESANSFALDIHRYLADEPVQAYPPSAGYRLRKFVRRNKTPVLAVVVVLIALVGGIIGTSWGLVRADRSARAEKAANETTKKRLEQVEKGNEIIAAIFTDLNIDAVKEGDRPLEAVLAERLVAAADRLEGDSAGEPLAVAAMQERLGTSLKSLGFADRAIPILQKSRQTREEMLGHDHAETLICKANLALSYLDAGKLDLARALFEEVLPLMIANSGRDHSDTLSCMTGLADTYLQLGTRDLGVPLFEEAFKRRKALLGADHPDTLVSANGLACAYEAAGKFELSLPLKEETLRLKKARHGHDHRSTLSSMCNLAEGYRLAGKLDKAVPLAEETVRRMKARLGPDHPATLVSMNNLGLDYRLGGRLDLAVPLFEETHERMKAKLGPDHVNTLKCTGSLAQCYRDMGKHDLALPLAEEAYRLLKGKPDRDHVNTLDCMDTLAQCYLSAKKSNLAIPLYEKLVERWEARSGPDHPITYKFMQQLGVCYWSLHQLERSVPLFEKLLKRQEAALGRGHPQTVRTIANLAVNYLNAGRVEKAIGLLEEVYRASKKSGNRHRAGNELLKAYAKTGKNAQAAAFTKEMLADDRPSLAPNSPELAATLAEVGRILLVLGAFADAEPVLQECLAILAGTRSESWTTFYAQSLLGGVLLARKKYTAAEPLLLTGYMGMKKRVNAIPPQLQIRLPEAADRLVELYAATNRPAERKKWQAERAKYPRANDSSSPPKK